MLPVVSGIRICPVMIGGLMTNGVKFKPPVFRAGGLYDPDAASLAAGIGNFEPTRTNQDSKEEADINTIVRRFGITGEVPVSLRVPLPEAFFECDVEYRDCLDAIRAAAASFETLPAEVRARFANDPAGLVDFAGDPKNLDQLRAWGMAPPAVTPPA